jgi:GntR family transcriptional repressor for pyruvate dehydrogenase complex
MLPHKRIYEEIVEEIVRRIRSGELLVGQKLPPERVLADQLGVSRTALREALRTLESMGCVRSTKGDGNYINSVSPEHIALPFAAMLSQDKQLAADIIQVRQYLEVHMASMAATRATKEQLAHMYGAILDMQSQIEQGGNGIEGDNRFHLEIAKASQNKAFSIIVELLAELLAESRQATLNIPGQPAKSVADHLTIFGAIQAGSEAAAEAAMAEHLTKAQQNLVDSRNKKEGR